MDENREKELKDGMRMKGNEGGDGWQRTRGGKEDESMRWKKGCHYKRRDEKKTRNRWIDTKTRLLGWRRKGGSRSHVLCYYGDRNG